MEHQMRKLRAMTRAWGMAGMKGAMKGAKSVDLMAERWGLGWDATLAASLEILMVYSKADVRAAVMAFSRAYSMGGHWVVATVAWKAFAQAETTVANWAALMDNAKVLRLVDLMVFHLALKTAEWRVAAKADSSGVGPVAGMVVVRATLWVSPLVAGKAGKSADLLVALSV